VNGVEFIIDAIPKFVSAITGLLTLFLMWRVAIPKLEQIHVQTNSLAAKAEAGARAIGVQEGLKQALDADPAVARAAALVLSVAADRAANLVDKGSP
jgi:hypothetical protein